MELKGVEGGDRKRGTLGGEMRRAKSFRNGVHNANAVVRGPVYRTRLTDKIFERRREAFRAQRVFFLRKRRVVLRDLKHQAERTAVVLIVRVPG